MGLNLRVIPQTYKCFGQELGYGLDSDGRLPNNKPILRFVAALTALIAVITVLGAVIAF